MIEHTPTPWTIEPPTQDDLDHDIYGMRIIGGGDPEIFRHVVARVEKYTGTSEADGAFILRACNSHDELIAKLKLMTAIVEGREVDSPWWEAEDSRELIAKVENQ